MPTVQEMLARPDLVVLVVARVSGIPYLLASGPRPPGWEVAGHAVGDTLWTDGEVYGWRRWLHLSRETLRTQSEAHPKAGIGSSNASGITFRLPGLDGATGDEALSLLVRDLLRLDESVSALSGDLSAAAVTSLPIQGGAAEFVTAGSDPEDQVAFHIGREAFLGGEASYVDDDEITGIAARGRWGSWPMAHRIDTDINEARSGRGLHVTSWPIVWGGRVLDIWFVLGRRHNGRFDPLSKTAAGAAILHWWSGVTRSPKEGGDLLSADVPARGLEDLLERKVCNRQPRGRLFASRSLGSTTLVHIGPHNWRLAWTWYELRVDVDDNEYEVPYVRKVARLRRRVGGVYGDVPEGLYELRYVAIYIEQTMREAEAAAAGLQVDFVSVRLGVDGDGKLLCRIDGQDATHEDRLALHVAPSMTGGRTVWGYLGVDEGPHQSDEDEATAPSFAYRPSPGEYEPEIWPEHRPYPTRIYVEKTGGADFDVAPAWFDDDGAIIKGHLRIEGGPILELQVVTALPSTLDPSGREILEIEVSPPSWGSRTLPGPVQVKYKGGALRDEDLAGVKQIITLPNTSVFKALLYLWHGGSGVHGTLHAAYDKGWWGCGLALPSRLLDVDGVLELEARLAPNREAIVIEEPKSLREWIEGELILEMCVLVPGRAEDGSFKLRLRAVGAPLESRLHYDGTLYYLNATNSRVYRSSGGGGGVGLERVEENIINASEFKAGYDPQSQDYKLRIPQKDLISIGTWGESTTLSVELQSVHTHADVENLARAYAQRLWDRYSRPYEIIEADTAHALTWLWDTLRYVVFTSEVLPTLDAAGRGDVVFGQIQVQVHELPLNRGETSGRVTATAYRSVGDRMSSWAPSARLTSYLGGNTWQLAEREFSVGHDDVEDFEVGMVVRLWAAGTTTTLVRTITAVDLALRRVTFNGSVPVSSNPWWMSYSTYAAGTDDQRHYVALASDISTGGKTRVGLTGPTGAYERPFVYVY